MDLYVLIAGGVGLMMGALLGIFVLALLRPSSVDSAWRDGYEAAVADAAHDRLDFPSVSRKNGPEMDEWAVKALSQWREKLYSQGFVRLSFYDLETSYPIPLANRAELVGWVKRSFPGHLVRREDDGVQVIL